MRMRCVVCLVPAGHGSCYFSGSPPPSKFGAMSVSTSPNNPNRNGRPDGPAFETPLGRPTALAANGSDPRPARQPHNAAGHSRHPGRGTNSTANSTASDNGSDQHSLWARARHVAHNRTHSAAAAAAVSRAGGASPAGGITAASVGVSGDGPTCQCDQGWLGQFCQQSEFFAD